MIGAGDAPATITDLLLRFGDRWQLAYQSDLGVWSAERKSPDGRHVRFLAAHDPAELAASLADAEIAEP